MITRGREPTDSHGVRLNSVAKLEHILRLEDCGQQQRYISAICFARLVAWI